MSRKTHARKRFDVNLDCEPSMKVGANKPSMIIWIRKSSMKTLEFSVNDNLSFFGHVPDHVISAVSDVLRVSLV